MQREIEALLAAYIEDRRKEAKLVHDLLTALSVGAAGRARMFEAIKAAAGMQAEGEAASETTTIEIPKLPATALVDDLTLSIGNLRQARDAALRH